MHLLRTSIETQCSQIGRERKSGQEPTTSNYRDFYYYYLQSKVCLLVGMELAGPGQARSGGVGRFVPTDVPRGSRPRTPRHPDAARPRRKRIATCGAAARPAATREPSGEEATTTTTNSAAPWQPEARSAAQHKGAPWSRRSYFAGQLSQCKATVATEARGTNNSLRRSRGGAGGDRAITLAVRK